MATGYIIPGLEGGIVSATTPPGIAWTTAGRPYRTFADAATSRLTWTFPVPSNYSSALAAKILWSGSASTTTSHTCRWGVEVMAYTPETDSVAGDTDSFDTSNDADDDILGTTGKRIQLLSITLTNGDSIAASDYAAVRLSRLGSHANDDLTETAWLWGFSLEYTTT